MSETIIQPTPEEWQAVCSERDNLVRQLAAARADLEESRKKNGDLNRRCQDAESAARENVEKCRRSGVSFSRTLSRWSTKSCERKLAEAQVFLRILHDAADDLRCAIEIEIYPFEPGDPIGDKWASQMAHNQAERDDPDDDEDRDD